MSQFNKITHNLVSFLSTLCSTPSDGTNLSSSLVKSIFQHFSKSRVSRNTLCSIEKGYELKLLRSIKLIAFLSGYGVDLYEWGKYYSIVMAL
jgi:hypothetical protein